MSFDIVSSSEHKTSPAGNSCCTTKQ